jgi:hypothetical protein
MVRCIGTMEAYTRDFGKMGYNMVKEFCNYQMGKSKKENFSKTSL